MPNHFALFIYLGNVLIFFSFPLEAISLRLVYSIFRTFASLFFFSPTTCNVLPLHLFDTAFNVASDI